jgi:hypothetical protein
MRKLVLTVWNDNGLSGLWLAVDAESDQTIAKGDWKLGRDGVMSATTDTLRRAASAHEARDINLCQAVCHAASAVLRGDRG